MTQTDNPFKEDCFTSNLRLGLYKIFAFTFPMSVSYCLEHNGRNNDVLICIKKGRRPGMHTIMN